MQQVHCWQMHTALSVVVCVLHAQSKQKIIDKMVAKGLTEPVTRESTFRFTFPDCDKLPPPVLPFVDVSFSYSGKKEDYLYSVRF
jgi:ATP-binding cassette, subfamily F, member 2